MSRTYRTIMKQVDCNCGAPLYWLYRVYNSKCIRYDQPPVRICNHHCSYDYYSRHNLKRDKKPWNKPSKEFKKWNKKSRKAKERIAMQKKQYDCMPLFRKEDKWDWL